MTGIARAISLAVLLAMSVLSGCSAQRAYGAGQAWQRNECAKIHDAQQRRRCFESASTSYEQYRRETEASRASDQPVR